MSALLSWGDWLVSRFPLIAFALLFALYAEYAR